MFAAVDRGETAERVIRVTGPETMDVTTAMAEQALVTLEVQASEAQQEGMRAWEIALALAPDLPVGQHSDQVRIMTTHPERPLISVPISIEVRSALAITPSSAFMGFVDTGDSKAVVLKIRPRSGAAFEIMNAEVDDEAVTTETRRVGDSAWEVRITCRPAEAGIIDTKLVITTDIEGEERVEVDVYADARPAE